jgi:hypothetical protein
MCRALESKAKDDDFGVARKKVSQKTDGPSIVKAQINAAQDIAQHDVEDITRIINSAR